jgi:hypothetical protein
MLRICGVPIFPAAIASSGARSCTIGFSTTSASSVAAPMRSPPEVALIPCSSAICLIGTRRSGDVRLSFISPRMSVPPAMIETLPNSFPSCDDASFRVAGRL